MHPSREDSQLDSGGLKQGENPISYNFIITTSSYKQTQSRYKYCKNLIFYRILCKKKKNHRKQIMIHLCMQAGNVLYFMVIRKKYLSLLSPDSHVPQFSCTNQWHETWKRNLIYTGYCLSDDVAAFACEYICIDVYVIQ